MDYAIETLPGRCRCLGCDGRGTIPYAPADAGGEILEEVLCWTCDGEGEFPCGSQLSLSGSLVRCGQCEACCYGQA